MCLVVDEENIVCQEIDHFLTSNVHDAFVGFFLYLFLLACSFVCVCVCVCFVFCFVGLFFFYICIVHHS